MVLPQDVVERVTSYIRHQGAKSPKAIADLVAAGQAKLLDAIAGVTEDQAVRQPAEGEWSLRELMLHVVAAEGSVAGMIAKISAGEALQASDPNRAIGMQRADDGITFGQLLDELHKVNDRTLMAVRAIPSSVDLDVKPPHPFFGPLNVKEWAAFQRIHDEDHAQHAAKIIAATA
jgi:hypothetical protein